ncbi:MAG TPA: cytidylate kinase family protein [Acidobacteriota bacterium]|nr:cytidylate kinase family protein [Acidobacteriota bacterium]
MAIVTLSYQYGSRGDTVAKEVTHRLGFTLITPARMNEIIRERYQLDYSLTGEIDQTPREMHSSKIFANLISAILTDMAVLSDIVVLECGGQFIFRAYPNALHVRIIAPRDVRAHNIMQDSGTSFEQALQSMEEYDRRHMRFLRASFRRPSETPERYDLIVNTGALDVTQAAELVLASVRLKKLADYGLVSNETVERAKLRNQIRLLRALTRLSIDKNQSLTQFAHPSELVFARLLDFYGIRWEYEPRTFPLKYDDKGTITEAFSPDFYLPDSDLYVELTTMKQSLVTKKNRKMKHLKELYPDIKIRLLYQKDFEDLIFKYTAKEPEKE